MKRRESVSHSVQFNCSIMSDSSGPHGLQHPRLPCPSPTPRAYSNSCPSCRLCHRILYCPLLLLPANFPSISVFLSQFFESGGHSFGVSTSASGLPMNIQNWFPLDLTGVISLQSKGLTRVSSNTTVQRHQFLVVPPRIYLPNSFTAINL